MNKINEVLNNKELMSNIRTILIFIVVVSLPLTYLAIATNFDFKALFSFKIAGLGIIGIIDYNIALSEVKRRALEDELNENPDLQKVDKDIELQQSNISDTDGAIEFINKNTIKEQDTANKTLTANEISNLNYKISKLKIKGKSFLKLQKKIDRFKQCPLYDKKFKPVKASDILFNDNSSSNDKYRGGRESYVYNPRGSNWIIRVLMTGLKFVGFGGTFASTLAIKEDLITILLFYAMLIISILVGSIFAYIGIRYKTANKYLKTQRNKLRLLKELNEYIQTTVLDVNEVNKTMEDTKDEN